MAVMDFTRLSPYLLILTLSFLSSPSQTLGNCGTCSPAIGPLPLPPVTVPPVIEKPPITLPPVIEKPPITLPPVIEKPPIILPPIIEKPPITIPVINPPATKTPPCSPPKPKPKPKPTPKPCPPTPAAPTPTAPPPTAPPSCPIDTIKIGACLDVLGAVVHVGDPAAECCPLITGITSVQAAVCLCTIIKANALGINVFFPIALELLVTCGKTPPPGYKCV